MKQLTPITRKNKKDIKNEFFVFDTETTALEPMPENFVFGVIYGHNYTKVIFSVEDFINEFKNKQYINKHIFAHNAEFDLSTIFGNIYENLDQKAIFNGKFISAKYKKITFADSTNIFPTSVKKLGELQGLKKLENDKVIKNTLTKENITEHDINYCIRDCEVVYNALLEIFESINAIKLTLASISLYDFRKNFLDSKILYNELTECFFESYYGGRNECFLMGDVDCMVYDINSLYPFAMNETDFPDPANLKKEVNVNLKRFDYLLNRYEGMVKIKVHHKDHYFGFLPFRSEKFKNKLLFPIGDFETTVNFNELRFALKHNVINILSVDYCIYADSIESPFKKFIQAKYKKRLDSDDEFEKYKEKIIMNANYGKWAQRIKTITTYYNSIPYEEIEKYQLNEVFYELKLFSKTREDCYLITENTQVQKSFHSIPLFSSYITSYSRITLLQGLLDNINNKPAYCDTDSIFCHGEFIGNVGKNLGQFKLEDKRVTKINGLKNYEYEEHNVKKKAIKGVNKNAVQIGENKYKDITYFKTSEALRRNKKTGSKKETIKLIKNTFDKRIVFNNGETYPIKLLNETITNQI